MSATLWFSGPFRQLPLEERDKMPAMPEMRVKRHAPIREQVASILRDAIVDMRLAPGQLVVERQLCEMTMASRPSVREALRQLEAEGLVESQNGRGTFVTVVSADIARDVYQVRAELEGLAVQLFTERADDSLRAEVRGAVARIADAVTGSGETIAILTAKNELYDLLFRGASNPVLHQTVKALQRRVNQLRELTLRQPGRPAQSLDEIQRMAAAIEARDPLVARAAAVHHVEQAGRTVLRALDQERATASED